MKRTIDDLPMVKAWRHCGRMATSGRKRKTARIRFDDGGVGYQVGVTAKPLPSGGMWAMFICPRCRGGAQRLRLLDGQPACGKCVRASGLIYRSQSVRTEKRHAVTAPPRLVMLNSDKPARLIRGRAGSSTGGETSSLH